MRKAKVFLVLAALAFLISGPAAGADTTVIQGQGPREFRRVIKVDGSGRLTGGIHVIDACEATTDWTALSNDTTGLDTDLDHVLGAKSLEWDKVDGAANTIFGGIQKTISSVDLSFLVENGGSFGYSLNVSATTDIAYCFLRLGTDASNYNEWRVADAGLSAGWNSLRFNANAPSSAGATGNGWNAAAVTYLALGCAFDLETSTLADLRADHVTAHVGLQVAADVNASVSSSNGAGQVDVQKLGGNVIDLGAGAVGAGTQRKTSASDDPAVVSLGVVAGDTTSLDVKVTTDDLDTDAGEDPVQRVAIQIPTTQGAFSVGNTFSLPVSLNISPNLVTNALWFRISQNGVNAMSATYPLVISATMAANTAANPLFLQPTDGTAALPPPYAKIDDDETTGCVAITNASQQYTWPLSGDWYYVKAVDNSVFLLGGANPTATTAVNGHMYPLSEGERILVRPASAKVAFIGPTTAGEICFLRQNKGL